MASVELSARDWAVLDRLRELGDSLEQPRHTLFFFYKPKSGDVPYFDQIREDASRRGLTVAGEDGDGLILEGHLHVDPVSIAPFLKWAEEIADQARAVFDGWECAVIAPKL